MTTVAAADFSASTPQFYQHSGKAPPRAVGLGIAVAVASGVLVGTVYGAAGFLGHLLHYTKLIAVAEVLSAMGAAALLGFVNAKALNYLHSRSKSLNRLCTLISALVTLYFAWVAWVFCFLTYVNDNHEMPNVFRLMEPSRMGRIIAAIYENGTWGLIDDVVPKGIFLAAFWVGEAAILLGLAFKICEKQSAQVVYCENCRKWGTRKSVMQFKAVGTEELKKDLLAGNFEALAGVTPRSLSENTWCNVALEGCADCDNTQALTLERIVFTPKTKNNQATTKIYPLVNRMILTPDQTAKVAMAAAVLTHPVAAPEPEPVAAEVPAAENPPAET